MAVLSRRNGEKNELNDAVKASAVFKLKQLLVKAYVAILIVEIRLDTLFKVTLQLQEHQEKVLHYRSQDAEWQRRRQESRRQRRQRCSRQERQDRRRQRRRRRRWRLRRRVRRRKERLSGDDPNQPKRDGSPPGW